MKRTRAHRQARIASEIIDMNLESLTKKAISSGIFKKPGSSENYGYSWIYNRLTRNDLRVANKLVDFAEKLKKNAKNS